MKILPKQIDVFSLTGNMGNQKNSSSNYQKIIWN
jgi:hypothetical protein